ncbi:MAG: NTP transferase domain-containing protein [Myxococcota bacterium]
MSSVTDPTVAPSPPDPAAAAVLLAGGHGRRAGGPKALICWEDDLLWRWQASRLVQVGCRPVVAVLHPDAFLPQHARPDLPQVLTLPSDPDAPQFASLQRGLRRLSQAGHDGPVLLLPVDCPCPDQEVFRVLEAAWRQARQLARPVLAVRPERTVTGPDGAVLVRHGHPVLLDPDAVLELLALDGATARLDRWIAGLPPEARVDVPVRDASVLANFNRDGVAG